MHWSHDWDVENNLIKSSMRKNKLQQMMQLLNFTDNTALDVIDKYCKLRLLITHLQKNCGKHFISQQYLYHDEALIEYFGRNLLKQHIIPKPIIFGFFLELRFDGTDHFVMCNEGTPGVVVHTVVVVMCMVAKNATEVFAQSALSIPHGALRKKACDKNTKNQYFMTI